MSRPPSRCVFLQTVSLARVQGNRIPTVPLWRSLRITFPTATNVAPMMRRIQFTGLLPTGPSAWSTEVQTIARKRRKREGRMKSRVFACASWLCLLGSRRVKRKAIRTARAGEAMHGNSHSFPMVPSTSPAAFQCMGTRSGIRG
jgi:hypothetical protein